MSPARPLVSVVIPTQDRPALVREAVESALGQSVRDLEVVVVDDGSREPVDLPPDPRLRLVRRPVARGNAAARNAGLDVAQGRWVTCLDDDDLLLADHVEVGLDAIAACSLPEPVGSLSGLAVISPDGTVRETRLPPPARPRGSVFSLEPLEPGRSYLSKQTLVVATSVLRGIGGWDEGFRSRSVSELFLRLNPVCSLIGVDQVTYHLREHGGPRVSGDRALRQRSFELLEEKHAALFALHPGPHAEMLLDHAHMSFLLGQRRSAAAVTAKAMRRAPRSVAHRAPALLRAALTGLRSQRAGRR